jgi:hypothetical protein
MTTFKQRALVQLVLSLVPVVLVILAILIPWLSRNGWL